MVEDVDAVENRVKREENQRKENLVEKEREVAVEDVANYIRNIGN